MDSTPSLPAPPRASRQRWFVLGLLLLFVGLSVQYTFKVLDPRGTRSAIVRWREQLLSLDEGETIYERYNYPNPPIMALLLNPLAELPPLAGALTWYYLKVGMALLAFYGLFRMTQAGDVPFPPWGQALAVLLSLRPVVGDLVHGNVNLFILFLVLAALYATHKGQDVLGGLLLALGIACKVTPALFLPYFLWKRAWRALAGCAAGLVLFFAVVPSLFLGWGQNARLLATWADQMVKPVVFGGLDDADPADPERPAFRDGVLTSTHNNQSLPGLVYRLGTRSPSFVDYGAGRDQAPTYRYHNLFDVGPAAARRLVKAGMVLFALLVVWSCRTPWARRGGWRLTAEFSLIVLGMLLFSERTWKHHCVTLMLPFGVLCYSLSARRPGPWLRGYLIATLVAATLLMATTSTSLFDLLGGEETAKLAQVYGAYVWAYLVLATALVVLLRRPEVEVAEAPAGVPRLSGLAGRREVLVGRLSLCLDPLAGRFGGTVLPMRRRPS